MDSISYIGEHLWPGRIGSFAIQLAFVAGLLAAVAYYFSTQQRDRPEATSWRNIGRAAFGIHGMAIFTTIGVLFYMMINRFYEYQYVQNHISDDLPFRYIFSAFWEGQEGSFLLWMFWHVVLGIVLILTARRWEAPVLSILSLIQVCLVSMILGIYLGFGDDPIRIGSNPMVLLRDVMDAPIFRSADYVELIEGTGLNPLLQNYWMTIHPPTLFLGFASTAVPFCFAVAGLWTREHRAWLQPALRWSLFSGAILGLGILMGAAWAYEALTFGGYWAWDPVENLSLVPWLILLAGIHTNLIARATGYSIRTTYVFYLLSFLLVLYSTYMTRSGILGESSVHSFTEMGLEAQLIGFIAAFLGLGTYLFFSRYRGVPVKEKEEATASKEFWMFIGTLILLFSAMLITGSTSLPVFNAIYRLFDPGFQGITITDQVAHHNQYQLWIGVFIGLLSGLAQFLRFREPSWRTYRKKYWKQLAISLVAALGLTALTALWIEARAWQYLLLLFSGLFAVTANLNYLITFVRGRIQQAGSSLSHIGFGLLIVGILASGLNKEYISSNPYVMDGLIEGADDNAHQRNIILFKNMPMQMDKYRVEYVGDTVDGFTRTYTVDVDRLNEQGQIVEEFELRPNILYNKDFSKIVALNPSTQRYWNKDIFTHITSLPASESDAESRRALEDSLKFRSFRILEGETIQFQDTVPIRDRDTFSVRTYELQVLGLDRYPTHPDYEAEPTDFAVGARLAVRRSGTDSIYQVQPVLVLRDQLLYSYPVQINDLSTKIRLDESLLESILPAEETLDYTELRLRQGEELAYGDLSVRFAGFNRNPQHPNYQAEKEDIAVGALLEVRSDEGKTYQAQPVYLIRGNRPYNIKDQIASLGLHLRFAAIDPASETITLMLARPAGPPPAIPLEIATNSPRADFMVLQAIVFPGINLVWLGSLLMLFGLAMSMYVRLRKRPSSSTHD